MLYKVIVAGASPIIHHNGAAGLDTRSPISREMATITSKRGGNRTEADDNRLRELECQRSLWLDEEGAPTIPPAAIRACVEGGARKQNKAREFEAGWWF